MMNRFKAVVIVVALTTVWTGPTQAHNGQPPTEPKGTFIAGQTAGFGASAIPDRDMLADYGGFLINTGGRITRDGIDKSGYYQSVGAAVTPTYSNGSGFLQGSDLDPGAMLSGYPDRFFGWTHVDAFDQQVQYTSKLDNAVLSAGVSYSVGTDFTVAYLGYVTDPTQPAADTLDVDLSYAITGLLKTSANASSGFGYGLYVLDAETGQTVDSWEGFFSQSGLNAPFATGFDADDYDNTVNGFSETLVDAGDSWTASLQQNKEYIIAGSAFAIGDTFDGSASYESDFGDTVVTTITPGAANPNAVFTIVPEPAGLSLIVLGAAALFRRR